MLNKIIDLGVQNRLMVVLALLAAIIGGVLILPRLNLDAFPDVTNVQVQINTEAQGLAAEEVEQLITFPIEAVMYALPDVEEVRSISKTGLSVITVVFEEGSCSSGFRQPENKYPMELARRAWVLTPLVWVRFTSTFYVLTIQINMTL